VNETLLCQLLADFIVVIHAAFILFVLFGGISVIFWPKAVWVHLPSVIWGIVIELTGWICPLTPLENSLRAGAGKAPYAGDFVIHYLEPVIYPEGLTRNLQFVFGALVFLLNAVLYGYFFLIRDRRKPQT
jgi:hypothetical protein